MRFTTFVALTAFALSLPVLGQEPSGRQSVGIDGSFAPTSSQILIGKATQRRTWTAGFEYAFTLVGNHAARLDYEASVSPVFLERDPTLTGSYYQLNGVDLGTSSPPTRVIAPTSEPIGIAPFGPGLAAPLYGTYGSEETYGATASPVGFRVNGFNAHKLQPTFSVDLGFVASGRAIPIDNAARFNFLFSFGPGFEYYYRRNEAVRVEYLYRHLSNANTAAENPGVDQLAFRVTLTRHF